MDHALTKKIIYTNISNYKVDDLDCQNLALKSIVYGIERIVIGPSSVPLVEKMIVGKEIEMGVSISYPSGAYFSDAKAGEIEELVVTHPGIGAFYVVMAVGRFLSGYEKEAAEEMKIAKQAAKGRQVYLMTEVSVLDVEQIKKICDFAEEAKLEGIVDTTGFEPYGVPATSVAETAQLVELAKGRFAVIAGCAETLAAAREKIGVGVDGVMMTDIDELI